MKQKKKKEERKKSEKKKKHNEKIIKDKIIRDIRTLFEQKDEDYYKPKRVSSFWNNYIEYGSNGDKNNNLSLEEYLNQIKPYLTDIIIDLLVHGKLNKYSASDNIEFITYMM